MTREVELKLEMTAEGADRLEAASLLPGEARTVRQHAVYFDTPGHALGQAGWSLRIRDDGQRRVQTIKAGGAAAGLFVRGEWECAVAGDDPILDDATPLAALLGETPDALAPLFVVENERRLWQGEGVEIALDRGRVIAGEREAPFCEVELEAKGADPAALFALARRIDALAPVQPGVLSKAERGYRLIGPVPAASKAGPVRLAATMRAADAFQAIVGECLRHLRLNVPLILDHQDGTALHQARVAMRRLRSALSIHKPMLGGARAAALNDELRWLAGALGDARDLDVLIARAGDSPLRARLLPARTEAFAHAAVALRSDRARALMLDIVEWVAIGDWLSDPAGAELRALPVTDFAAGALDRFRRKVRKDGRDLEQLDDEARHDLRKAGKKLRYATEFFASLYQDKQEKRRFKRFAAALEALQDQLGALNDLAAAPDLLRRLGLADEAEARPLVEGGRKADLLDAAGEAHDALVDARRFWR